MTGPSTIHLVGAGPGDPDLLTVRALHLLETADVVVHDRLVDLRIMDLVAPWAERIDVGKRPGDPSDAQERIHRVLVDAAARAGTVVRLKGGDPFVFGRGGEEIEALRAAGLHVEVVPGDTRKALDFHSDRAGYEDEWGRFKAERDQVARRLLVGAALDEALAQGGAVLDPIGAAGFTYPGPVYDRHGLVDPQVALRPPLAAARQSGHVRQVPRAAFINRNPIAFAARLVPRADAEPGSPAFWKHAHEVISSDPEGD